MPEPAASQVTLAMRPFYGVDWLSNRFAFLSIGFLWFGFSTDWLFYRFASYRFAVARL